MPKQAIITGASSGIGYEYASQLAEKNYNLVLIARREEKLKSLATNLEEELSIECEIIVADLSLTKDLNKIAEIVQNLDRIDLLINNAGFGMVGSFANIPYDEHKKMMDVHMTAPVFLTHQVIPKMIEQNYGRIINVASVAAYFPERATTLYAPTKQFLVDFSKSLNKKYKSNNIKFQALCPGYTYTDFHKSEAYKGKDRYKEKPGFLWMSSEDVVSSSLKALDKNKVIHVPGLIYKFVVFLTNFGIKLG